MERRRAGQKKLSKKDSEKGKSAEKPCNSPLAIPHCKYTSKTHPKLWQDAIPAPASFMNVTPHERKMITLQRRQGGGTGGGARQREREKSPWWIMPLVGQPCRVFGQDSNPSRFSVTAMIPFFFPFHPLLSSQTCTGCDNCASTDT